MIFLMIFLNPKILKLISRKGPPPQSLKNHDKNLKVFYFCCSVNKLSFDHYLGFNNSTIFLIKLVLKREWKFQLILLAFDFAVFTENILLQSLILMEIVGDFILLQFILGSGGKSHKFKFQRKISSHCLNEALESNKR